MRTFGLPIESGGRRPVRAVLCPCRLATSPHCDGALYPGGPLRLASPTCWSRSSLRPKRRRHLLAAGHGPAAFRSAPLPLGRQLIPLPETVDLPAAPKPSRSERKSTPARKVAGNIRTHPTFDRLARRQPSEPLRCRPSTPLAVGRAR